MSPAVSVNHFLDIQGEMSSSLAVPHGFDGLLLPRRCCRPAKSGRWVAWSGLESQLELAAVIQDAKLTERTHSVTRADPRTRGGPTNPTETSLLLRSTSGRFNKTDDRNVPRRDSADFSCLTSTLMCMFQIKWRLFDQQTGSTSTT